MSTSLLRAESPSSLLGSPDPVLESLPSREKERSPDPVLESLPSREKERYGSTPKESSTPWSDYNPPFEIGDESSDEDGLQEGQTRDGDLVFDPPAFLQLPLRVQSHKSRLPTTTIPPNRSYHFRGNYRRFLIFLFLSLAATSPIIYWIASLLRVTQPLQTMLFSITAIWGIACGAFYLGSYSKRSISVDHFGIYYEDELRTFYVTWPDIRSIHLHAVEAFFNPYPLCYVRLVTRSGHELAFANFGPHLYGIQRNVSFGNPAYPIIDVRDADFLLALLVQQVGPGEQTPDLERLRYRAINEMEIEEEKLLSKTWPKEANKNPKQWMGLWAMFGKIGVKWLPQSAKFLLQTIKPGYVGVSIGLYALFFQWQFALVLAMLLVGHELGHVWSMYRAGMRIRGVYLIPFFGAATVTEDTWPSWNALAQVSLAGPLWGAYLTAICFFLYILFPTPFWLMATVLGALLNLLNLLPVQPLDGGRILHAIAYSLRTSAGFALPITVLGGAMVLSLSLEMLLLFILTAIGIAEFFREYMYMQRAEKLALLRNRTDFSGRDVLLLKSITGINFGLNSSPQALDREKTLLKRLRMLLNAPPMTPKQMLRIGLATMSIATILFGFLLFITVINPNTQWALELFK